ncbi:MAG: chemotaxis protein CheB [Alphaproteobacteria bacterium CG_4_10_14_0_2_um_filter_63_37]|nr:MAG: chemotaxis protein CheB [Proteobacteria bacterium CG1_02_64_396]PJA24418.1 MAG: chemotaxis protein CheB [Alphaproteobacteria bacterium CG_4_10_14_0_2_um_filter_63_37]
MTPHPPIVAAPLPNDAPTPRKGKIPPFAIVGIGASAGGLEALELFFAHLPADCGMAFVVVLHLDPTHKGMMPELLGRTTTMPVVQAKSRMRVLPNHVYVIPPNHDLSILHDTLHLLDPSAPRGLRLPIDFFLRTLAQDRSDLAVAIILSGMGSDGAQGVRVIKEMGGLVLVQDPTTAKFNGMPNSAVATGMVDVVAPIEALPRRLLDCMGHPSSLSPPSPPNIRGKSEALDTIFILLRAHTGHDFSLYKQTTVLRRIERRMGVHQIDRIDQYLRFLRETPQELTLLFKELLIGVTSFFRDPQAWLDLQEQGLPLLLDQAPDGATLRGWVAGCSSGEEAYSLAIAFKEALARLQPPRHLSLQIFATDLDPDAIVQARQGLYPAHLVAHLGPERLNRFFVAEGGEYRIAPVIREMVVFAQQNLIMDPPFTKLDILTCRNLLIYLGAPLQKRLLPLFHYCLNPGGLLFLGSAETLGGFEDRFDPLSPKSRLFRRNRAPAEGVPFPSRLFPAMESPVESAPPSIPIPNLQGEADQLILRRFAPAAVLVNGDGDILYVSGRTGKYLEPAAGKANWNLYAMAREGLRQELPLALSQALRDGSEVVVHGIGVHGEGGLQGIDLTITPLSEPGPLQGMAMVVFHDITLPSPSEAGQPGRADTAQPRELKRALSQAHEEIRALRRAMQSDREELRSANEELQTVNAELQARVDELSWVNNDMKNLLNSTDIATVFLDNDLKIRRFTTQATKIFKLIPSDVGRALGDIVTTLDYPGLQKEIHEVLRTLVFHETQIPATEGRWYAARIMPYRTQENVISGVVMTFSDISKSKALEAQLRQRPTERGGAS